ncbi:MAG: hypothetical protein ACK42D_00985 [Candidatus Paceibacteria bacterium]
MLKYCVALLFLFPVFTFAQTSSTGSLQSLLVGIGGFLNSVVIPFILAIAFIVFVVNVVRFFVIGGDSDEGQKNAKNLAIYGIGAFVFILSFWGIINMLVDGVGLETEPDSNYICSDYMIRHGESCEPTPTPTPQPAPVNPPPRGGDTGNPLPPIEPPPSDETMSQIIAGIKSTMTRSLSVLDGLYGNLADYVRSDLFTEFLTDQHQQMTREQEARAIVRATLLELIPFSNQEDFFERWLAEQIASGILNPIDAEDIQTTLPRVPPANITARVEEVQNNIRRQLEAYAARTFVPPLTTPNNSNATPTQVITYLFNQSIDSTTRENYLITLIENQYDIIDASLGDDIYHQYININNVLTTYNARFNTIDERDPRFTGPR